MNGKQKQHGKPAGGVSNFQPQSPQARTPNVQYREMDLESAAYIQPYPPPLTYPYFHPMASVAPVPLPRVEYQQMPTSSQDGGLHELITEINNRLKKIESGFSKITPIEKDVAYLKSKITAIHENNSSIARRIGEVEKFCQTVSDIADDNINSKHFIQNELSSLKSENTILKEEIQGLKAKNTDLTEVCLQMQCRAMENNLIFFGIDEARQQHASTDRENVERTLRDFLKSQLNENPVVAADIDAEYILLDRVHRLGNPNKTTQNQRPRPIVAKFERFSDREKVRKAGSILNKSQRNFKVHVHFPREVEDKRKTLYPVARQHTEQGDKVALVRDKLYINNRLYDPSEQRNSIRQNTTTHRNQRNQRSSPNRQGRNQSQYHELSQGASSFQTPNRFSILQEDSMETTSQKRKARSPLELEAASKRSEPWSNISQDEMVSPNDKASGHGKQTPMTHSTDNTVPQDEPQEVNIAAIDTELVTQT